MIEVAIGAGVGVVYGAFGAGASVFATPLLALAGVPALAAVASPLPATIPAALAGAWSYRADRSVPNRLVLRTIAVALPAAVAGALASTAVGGTWLLVLTAVLLAFSGWRLTTPAIEGALPRHEHLAVVAAAGIGFLAGLLASSGGVLLVPVFVVLAGLTMRQAAASSLLVAAALAVPALVTHAALGHVDWRVAALFAVGLVPGTAVGARVSRILPVDRTQRAFGVLLVLFAGWYLGQLMP